MILQATLPVGKSSSGVKGIWRTKKEMEDGVGVGWGRDGVMLEG